MLRGTDNIRCNSFRWIDYSATIEARTAGVAILDHLANLRHLTGGPRGYGLSSVDPVTERSFTGDERRNGSHTISESEWVTFRYREVVHEGKTLPDDIEALLGDFVTGMVCVPETRR